MMIVMVCGVCLEYEYELYEREMEKEKEKDRRIMFVG